MTCSAVSWMRESFGGQKYTECVQSFFHADIVLFAQVAEVDFVLDVVFLKVVVGEGVKAGRHGDCICCFGDT